MFTEMLEDEGKLDKIVIRNDKDKDGEEKA